MSQTTLATTPPENFWKKPLHPAIPIVVGLVLIGAAAALTAMMDPFEDLDGVDLTQGVMGAVSAALVSVGGICIKHCGRLAPAAVVPLLKVLLTFGAAVIPVGLGVFFESWIVFLVVALSEVALANLPAFVRWRRSRNQADNSNPPAASAAQVSSPGGDGAPAVPAMSDS